MKYYGWIFIVFSFLTLNCQSVKTLQEIPDKDKLFTYQRTPCFGTCPVYEVTILQKGKVYFVGENFVPYLDTAHFSLPGNTLTQVKAILRHPDYLNIAIKEPEYQIFDIPGLIFRDYVNGRKYELDMSIPEAIAIITSKIDTLLEQKKLIYDKDIYPMIRTEILVELKPGTDPYSLDGKDTFYQLSYRDHVGTNIYKYELISAEERVNDALDVIKQRKGVLETQLNHQLERR